MLELTDMRMDAGLVSLSYNVRHNVGRLRTTLEQVMQLQVDPRTGKVIAGAMHIMDLSGDNVDDARLKMAVWCERLAAALRGTERKVGELPLFEGRRFKLEEQPLWLQQEYNRLVQLHVSAQTDDDHEAIKLWLRGHPMNLISDMVESAECEADRIKEVMESHPA